MALSIAVFTISLVGLTILALGVLVWLRMRSNRSADLPDEPGPENTPEGFSLARYEPMLRLLAAEDADFLRRETSCPPKMAAQWERDRRRIFGLYLKDLCADFRRLHARARVLVAESPEQYSDLVPLLMRQQIYFWRAMAGVELRLALSAVGLAHVDVRRLLEALEGMHSEILRLAAPAAA